MRVLPFAAAILFVLAAPVLGQVPPSPAPAPGQPVSAPPGPAAPTAPPAATALSETAMPGVSVDAGEI